MINKTSSFPTRSHKGLQGQDIIWTQFNDVSFFIEDKDQENLYFQTLKKLFPDIKFSKIFPLGGKDPVIKKAQKSLSNKKKVFIVDNDFDTILKKKKNLPNLFYLERYCIENYLFEKESIFEIIREENPTIKTSTIKTKFSISDFITDCQAVFEELTAHFLLIQKFELGIKYIKIDPSRDCDLSSIPKRIKNSAVQKFYNDVEIALKIKRPRVNYLKHLVLAKKYFKLGKAIVYIPGKYLANFLKSILKKSFRFVQCTCDTFIYRLMKNCSLQSLYYLKDSISVYSGI